MIAFIGASVCLVLAGSVRRCVVLVELRLDALAGHGIPRESAVPFWELVHPDDQQRLMEDRERLLLRGPGRMPARRVRMLRRDGTHRLIACGMRANPEEERIYLSGEDVTDHQPQVRAERFLLGPWDRDISRDSATWSQGMYEIYGLTWDVTDRWQSPPGG
jgi:PAS domain-containing protein